MPGHQPRRRVWSYDATRTARSQSARRYRHWAGSWPRCRDRGRSVSVDRNSSARRCARRDDLVLVADPDEVELSMGGSGRRRACRSTTSPTDRRRLYARHHRRVRPRCDHRVWRTDPLMSVPDVPSPDLRRQEAIACWASRGHQADLPSGATVQRKLVRMHLVRTGCHAPMPLLPDVNAIGPAAGKGGLGMPICVYEPLKDMPGH